MASADWVRLACSVRLCSRAIPKSQIFTNSAIATLELSPAQADTLINATSLGKISLVLRSVADFAQTGSTSTVTASTDNNQSVKVIRFGKALSVTPGSSQQQGQAEVNTAAYTPPTVVPTPIVTTTPTVTTTTTTPDAAPTVTTTTTAPASTAPVFVPGGSTPMTPPAVD